jgi:ribonuclease BN (tRNA processing enzyme)
MSGFRLVSLGVGNAFSALYYSSCFVLQAEGQCLMMDSPHPIRKIFREGTLAAGSAMDVDSLGGLVLTHLHADHASGVEGLAFYCRYMLGHKLPLFTHRDVAADLWSKHLAASMEWSIQEVGGEPTHRTLEEFVDLIPLEENRWQEHGPFRIRCRKTLHNIATIALQISACGRTLGYSADTAFDPTLIDWLAPCDLIVHEACGGPMHTSCESLLTLPRALRDKMLIIHYPDDFDIQASKIRPMRQGQTYEI